MTAAPRRLAALALWVTLLAGLPAAAQERERLVDSAKERLRAVVQRVEPLLGRYGYPAVVAVVALDTAGIPTPAASIMVAATLAADRGELRLGPVALLAFLATVLGSQVGYAIGRYGGRGLLARLPLAADRVAKLERGYHRWGAAIVVAAPLSEGMRQLNGVLAGTLGLAWPRFALANLAGSAVFVGLWVGGAWLLDRNLAALAPLLRGGRWWLIGAAALAALAGVAWLWRRRGERPEHAGTGARRPG